MGWALSRSRGDGRNRQLPLRVILSERKQRGEFDLCNFDFDDVKGSNFALFDLSLYHFELAFRVVVS